MRILLAEDEQDMNRILTRRLQQQGYSVDSCFDGREALDYLESTEYDAAVLDVMMPKMDGFQLLTAMREQGINTPVLFLTARDALCDRVEGLDLGAEDYLIKPFAFDELFARLRVILRRQGQTQVSRYECGDLVLDTLSHCVTVSGKVISLSAREYALLECMLRNKGIVLTREQIENSLWSFDDMIASNVVDVYIRMLRKKIDGDHDKKLIHTVRGYGYVIREEEA